MSYEISRCLVATSSINILTISQEMEGGTGFQTSMYNVIAYNPNEPAHPLYINAGQGQKFTWNSKQNLELYNYVSQSTSADAWALHNHSILDYLPPLRLTYRAWLSSILKIFVQVYFSSTARKSITQTNCSQYWFIKNSLLQAQALSRTLNLMTKRSKAQAYDWFTAYIEQQGSQGSL